MKNILISLTLLFFVFFLNAQTYQLITTNGLTIKKNKNSIPYLFPENKNTNLGQIGLVKSIGFKQPFQTNLLYRNFYKSSLLSKNEYEDISAGTYLIRSKNRFLTFLALDFAGALITSIANYRYNTISNYTDQQYLRDKTIGGTLVLTGFCFSISAWLQIGKAGNALNYE